MTWTTSGFVGSAIGRHLRQHGWSVTGLSRQPARPDAVDQQIQHDLSKALPNDIPRHDVVVHAAALASPWARPEAFATHVVLATANMLDYVARTRPSQYQHISTSAVFYTHGDQFGITEETPLPVTPINEYARAKRKAEALVTSRLTRYLILRPRAVYGPGDTVVFPRILRAARIGLLPRIIRPDGVSPIADLIYIGNLTHIVQTAIERKTTGAINITDGTPIDTNAMLTDILVRLGYHPPRLRLPLASAMRIAVVMEWFSSHLFGWREPPLTRFGVSAIAHSKTFDVSHMRAQLGEPPFSTDEGIAAFVDWQKAGAAL